MKSGQDRDLACVHRFGAFAKPRQEVGPKALREEPEGRRDAGIREEPRVQVRDRCEGNAEKMVLGGEGASLGSEAGKARRDRQDRGGNPSPKIAGLICRTQRPASSWARVSATCDGNLFMSWDVSIAAGERELGLGIAVRFLSSLVALGGRSDEGSRQGRGKDSVRPLAGQGRGGATSQGHCGRQ